MECTNLKNIILELQNAATQVDEEQVEKFADAIIAAKNNFVAGQDVLDLQQEDLQTDCYILDFMWHLLETQQHHQLKRVTF